jgi:hypothetical protein
MEDPITTDSRRSTTAIITAYFSLGTTQSPSTAATTSSLLLPTTGVTTNGRNAGTGFSNWDTSGLTTGLPTTPAGNSSGVDAANQQNSPVSSTASSNFPPWWAFLLVGLVPLVFSWIGFLIFVFRKRKQQQHRILPEETVPKDQSTASAQTDPPAPLVPLQSEFADAQVQTENRDTFEPENIRVSKANKNAFLKISQKIPSVPMKTPTRETVSQTEVLSTVTLSTQTEVAADKKDFAIQVGAAHSELFVPAKPAEDDTAYRDLLKRYWALRIKNSFLLQKWAKNRIQCFMTHTRKEKFANPPTNPKPKIPTFAVSPPPPRVGPSDDELSTIYFAILIGGGYVTTKLTAKDLVLIARTSADWIQTRDKLSEVTGYQFHKRQVVLRFFFTDPDIQSFRMVTLDFKSFFANPNGLMETFSSLLAEHRTKKMTMRAQRSPRPQLNATPKKKVNM